mmetsp:Transcript_17100/g.33607  ORF Transcript_17100/g.33607 Transcript_17100/m.33607 type:complete len:326 (-) Transcript_17100:23-1000(-)|eukprot:CAMPEP_0173390500 /NCGR_PEP_ID=MMETSP1356-20130122/15091_1 /TAXON_ID=77927 ORGANISM="Hemiselmis virescens, Strain PCC157" /NCGR_SAMPLE_ID=MMETSP1356 /ASSEMBLY_ACC=CAM_ASM_000847 /LENGTH=325 /DNA_ID=CAMNT_0014347911 /DNA_START=66 /DNA_END=1043 /DNA_ORIENTATION=+
MVKQHMCEEALLQKDMTGKTVIVTGGNSGIGFICAKQLCSQGATVVLTSRNLEAGQKCAEECTAEAAKAGKTNKCEAMRLDLADLKTVVAFAEEFKSKHKQLHVLLNNAGVMAISKLELSKQGYEMQLATNHIGHHLLTNLLLPTLKASAPSRIVDVSSAFHDYANGKEAKMDWDDLNFTKRKYDPWTSYGQSKLANVLHALELSKRLQGTNVAAVSLHPGWVESNLMRHAMPGFVQWLTGPIMNMLGRIDGWKGSQTSLFCCLDDSIMSHSGEYYSQVGSGPYKRCPPPTEGWPMKSPNPQTTPEDAAKLWDMTEAMIKEGLAK